MFGPFKRRKLETVAALLRSRSDQAIRQYLRLSADQLDSRLRRDFPGSFQFDHVRRSFEFPDDRDFRFVIDMGDPGDTVMDRYLTIFAKGRFQGFMLTASDDAPWVCSATDIPPKRATRSARALASYFDEELGVRDISESMC